MSDLGIVESEIQGLANDADKPIWKRIFREVVKRGAFGAVDAVAGQKASVNFKGHLLGPITTPAIANTEFTVAHSFGVTPYLVLQVLPNETDAELIPLKWSRAWDSHRIYVKSSVTGKVFYLYCEGG